MKRSLLLQSGCGFRVLTMVCVCVFCGVCLESHTVERQTVKIVRFSDLFASLNFFLIQNEVKLYIFLFPLPTTSIQTEIITDTGILE